MAVFLALEALLQSALSLVSFALENLALPNETLVYDSIGVLQFGELDDDGRCGFRERVSGQPSYVFYLCSRDERTVVL